MYYAYTCSWLVYSERLAIQVDLHDDDDDGDDDHDDDHDHVLCVPFHIEFQCTLCSFSALFILIEF